MTLATPCAPANASNRSIVGWAQLMKAMSQISGSLSNGFSGVPYFWNGWSPFWARLNLNPVCACQMVALPWLP